MCRFCFRDLANEEQKPHFEPLRRGWGFGKRVQMNFTLFLTVFGHFGLFCALCYILVKTQSFFLGGPANG